jgi:hypothetical protein
LLVGKICIHISLKKGPKTAIFIEAKSGQFFNFYDQIQVTRIVHLTYYNMCEFCTMIPISLFITKIARLSGGYCTILVTISTIKLQLKVDKNPTWLGSWMMLDVLFHCREGLVGPPLKNVMASVEHVRQFVAFV